MRCRLLVLARCLAVGCLALVRAGESPLARDESTDYRPFNTCQEPRWRASNVVVVNLTQPARLNPGYIFIAPFPKAGDQEIGPQILDQRGQLVWYGNDSARYRVQNFHPCNYLGSPTKDHLCWSEADNSPTVGIRAWNRVFDSTYTPVGRPYGATGHLQFPNPHEFKVTADGRSFLQAVYHIKELDLTPYAGGKQGYVQDGCFQEVEMVSGDAIFEWCGLEHLELWHTYIFLDVPENVVNKTGELYGDGSVHRPWDYFHLNAVDKNEESDYYVSARHLNTILKIAGLNSPSGKPPGDIIWRLGGKFNDFTGVDAVDISRQHHVRQVKMTSEQTILSFFDNQWQTGPNLTRGTTSSAVILSLNNKTMEVEKIIRYMNPETGALSLAQGSVQVLPNGNVFVGWGTVPEATEFAPDGTVLSHMHLGHYELKQHINDGIINYRTFKWPWVGRPLTRPKVMAYTLSCSLGEEGDGSPLWAYVSWNGATEVKRWRMYTSQWSELGPWVHATTADKDGFETRIQLWAGDADAYRKYVKVEALGASGAVLASGVGKTWVPNEATRTRCDETGCEPGDFAYDEGFSVSNQCASPPVAPAALGYGTMLATLVCIEVGMHLFQSIMPAPNAEHWRFKREPRFP